MKLLYCKKCNGVINLDMEEKRCPCGMCGGVYEQDGQNATFFGDAIPFAIDNFSFYARALKPENNVENEIYDTWHGHQKIQCWILKGDNPNVSSIQKIGKDDMPLDTIEERQKKLEANSKLRKCGA